MTFEYGYNIFEDYLMKSILYGVDIADPQARPDITTSFITILKAVLSNPVDVVNLDFDIIKHGEGYYEVVGLNFITALWLSGVFPAEVDVVMANNIIEMEGIIFEYDKKTNKLSYTYAEESE